VHFGRALRTSRAELLEALDPWHFVAIRRSPGGPAPEAIRPALELAQADLADAERWIQEKSAALAAYPHQIKSACNTLLAE
jgi:argininosuccinate lyase